jgi:hypothetical protein
MALTSFLTRLLQSFLELLDFLGQLRKVMVHGITFSSAFLSGTEMLSPFRPFQTYDNHKYCVWYMRPHASFTGCSSSQSGLSWEPWP